MKPHGTNQLKLNANYASFLIIGSTTVQSLLKMKHLPPRPVRFEVFPSLIGQPCSSNSSLQPPKTALSTYALPTLISSQKLAQRLASTPNPSPSSFAPSLVRDNSTPTTATISTISNGRTTCLPILSYQHLGANIQRRDLPIRPPQY
jgi:hypothetical protein